MSDSTIDPVSDSAAYQFAHGELADEVRAAEAAGAGPVQSIQPFTVTAWVRHLRERCEPARVEALASALGAILSAPLPADDERTNTALSELLKLPEWQPLLGLAQKPYKKRVAAKGADRVSWYRRRDTLPVTVSAVKTLRLILSAVAADPVMVAELPPPFRTVQWAQAPVSMKECFEAQVAVYKYGYYVGIYALVLAYQQKRQAAKLAAATPLLGSSSSLSTAPCS